MRMPLFGIGMQGLSPVVTAKYMQNFYAEQRPAGERSQIAAHGFPGEDLFVDFGATAVRGTPLPVEQNDLLYVVHRGVLQEVNNTGTKAARGTLNTTSGYVEMAHNGTVIVIVDGTNGYTYNTSTASFATIASALPANPLTVTWIDGYFIAGFATGRFYISTDGTTWDALDFANAESNPDGVKRVYNDQGQVIIFGDISTEFWGNTGALDFPFAKIQGADQEWGLAAPASVAKLDNSVAFLCKNRMGEVIIGRLVGNQVQKISTPDLDSIINKYAAVSDATAHSYMLGGHPMYQINFPSAGYSWSFDALSNFWSIRKSEATTRQRNEYGSQYLNKTVFTDSESGKMYRLNADVFTENGSIIEGEIVGDHLPGELERGSIDTIRLDMEVGVGTTSGQGSNPQVMLQVSKNGGKTFGNERWTSAGALGEYDKRVEWRRFGDSRRWTFKIRITDPIKRTIVGVYVNPQD